MPTSTTMVPGLIQSESMMPGLPIAAISSNVSGSRLAAVFGLVDEAQASALIGGAASQVTNAIFTKGAPSSGMFSLDGATVSYKTVGGNVVITVNDGVSTNTLTVPVPPTP